MHFTRNSGVTGIFPMLKSGHCKNRRTSPLSMPNKDVDCGCRKIPQPTNPATITLAKIIIRFSKLIFMRTTPLRER